MPEVFYRVGRSWGTTIICEEKGKPDRLMGTMQTREDAALVVGCLNAVAAVLAKPAGELAPGQMPLRLAYAEEQLSRYDAAAYDELLAKVATLEAENEQLLALLAERTEDNDDPIRCALIAVKEAQVSAPVESAPVEHPERICKRCGGPNVTAWAAPSPLWNQVMRGGDINNPDRFDGIVCPVCFAALAEEAEIARRWRFYADRVLVPLQTVTPSGRVWNDRTWLWVDAADVHRPTAFLPIGSPHKEVCRACDEPWPCADADSAETIRAAASGPAAGRLHGRIDRERA